MHTESMHASQHTYQPRKQDLRLTRLKFVYVQGQQPAGSQVIFTRVNGDPLPYPWLRVHDPHALSAWLRSASTPHRGHGIDSEALQALGMHLRAGASGPGADGHCAGDQVLHAAMHVANALGILPQSFSMEVLDAWQEENGQMRSLFETEAQVDAATAAVFAEMHDASMHAAHAAAGDDGQAAAEEMVEHSLEFEIDLDRRSDDEA